MLTSEDPAMADTTTTDASPPTSDLPSKLTQLKASATQQYSLKNYSAAAEFYSEAAEIQDQLNGEMSPENADLLYQYGRCLYHVAVSKSDVLGGKVAGTGGEEPKRKKRKVGGGRAGQGEGSTASAAANANGEGSSGGGGGGVIGSAMKDGEQKLAEDVVEAVVEDKDGVKDTNTKEGDASLASKPYFQITGDENWTDSEGEEDDETAADAEAEEEEEEDDFAIAYEILDVARVLLKRKLEAKFDEEQEETAESRQIAERLADTHDLQAEISLENERFLDAINDTRDALALKLDLYPEESSLIAEAHFKLSLALEFASVTSTNEDSTAAEEGDSSENKPAQVDETLRAEAATSMEAAIASCNARITKEETLLPTLTSPEKQREQEKSIADVKEMVADMSQRLLDLRNPAVNLSGITGPAGAPDGSDPLRGVLGAMLGESKVQQQERIKEATEKANDLSGLVKHRKKPKAAEGEGMVMEGKGKRKADDEAVVREGANGNGNGKKVKFAAVEDGDEV